MKSYRKANLVAKNARSGSYAAGCPDLNSYYQCKQCERTM